MAPSSTYFNVVFAPNGSALHRVGQRYFRTAGLLLSLWLIATAGYAQLYYITQDAASSRNDQIRRVNYDGTGQTILYTNFADSPTAMAIDRLTNKAFVAESRPTVDPKVISVDLSSGSSTTIASVAGFQGCQGIAIDPVNQYVYYSINDGVATTTTDQIRRVKFDGTGDALFVTNYANVAGSLTIDLANNRLFAIDTRGTAPQILSINLSTSAVTTILPTSSIPSGSLPRGVTYNSLVNKVYYMLDDQVATTSTDPLRRLNPDGTGDELVLDNFGVNSPGLMSFDKAGNLLFILDVRATAPEIYKVDLSTNTASVVTSSPVTDPATFTLRGIDTYPTCATFATSLTPSPSSTLTCAQPTLTLTATGGGTYVFRGPSGTLAGSGNTRTISAPGTYSVIVTDAEGCTALSTTTITSNTTPPTVSIGSATTELNCITSAITLTATGGGTYRWDNGTTNATRNVNVATTYSVTVTGANGCTAVATKTITSNTTPAAVSLTATNVCAGQSVTLTATPGLVDYTFTTPSGTVNTALNNVRVVPGLAAGPYSFTVAARHPTSFCQATATAAATVSSGPTPTLTASPAGTLTCAQTSLTLTAGGGTSYAFARVGGGSGLVSSDPAGGTAVVNASGTYSVTVNASGCFSTTTISINGDQTAPTIGISPTSGTLTCATTSLTLTATTSGTGVIWSTNATSNSIVVTTSGTYGVTATGANGCSATTSVTIDQNTTAPNATLSASNSAGVASNTLTCAVTSLTLTAGNVPGGSYVFTGPSGVVAGSGNTRTVSEPGTYTVLVTGANGCTATASTVISQSVNLPTATLAASGTLTCAVTSVTLTATGAAGVPGNTYAFAGPGVVSQNATAGTAVANQSGTYSVTVTNTTTGCFSVTTTTVESNTTAPTVNVSPTSGTLTCLVTSLTLTASGTGTSYRWTGGSIGNTLVVTTSGTYAVTATGANGCTAVSNGVVIDQNIAAPGNPQLSASNSGTLTCAVASLTLTASATGTGLTYAFAGPSGTLAGSGNTRAVSSPGTYTVTITGANGCTATATTTVSSNTTAPTATLTPSRGAGPPSATLTCAQTSLTLTATGGSPYIFVGPGIVSQNAAAGTAIINAPGTYSVTVTGANGCTASIGTVISQSVTLPAATLTASPSGTLTCSQTSLTLTATGGNSYAFAGPSGTLAGSGNTRTINASGTYSVTVTNTITGCFSVTTTTIFSNTTAPTATLTASRTAVCTPGNVTLTAGTGTSYAFSGPGLSQSGTSATAIVSQGGTFSVVVTGSNGCTASAGVVISSSPTPAAPALSGASLTYITSTTPLALTTLVTATPPNTLSFFGTGGLVNPPVANISSPGVQTFSAIQTNAAGCVSPATVFSVTALSPLPPSSQSTCRGSNVVMNVLPTGVSYQWFRHASMTAPGARLSEVASLYRGTTTASLTLVGIQTTSYYSCQVTQANGTVQTFGPFAVVVPLCSARASAEPELAVRVSVAPNPVADGLLRTTISGAGGQRLTVTLTDEQGRVIREQQWTEAADEQRVEWNVADRPAGMLLLRATTDRQSQTLKVLNK